MALVGSLNLRVVVAFSAVLAVAALANAETKPQFTLTTKAAQITVTVDDVLRKHPGLYDNLLSEGRRWAGRVRGQAEEEFKTYPETFENRLWVYERTYVERSVVGPYISILREDGQVIGTSPQPSTVTESVLWDREKRRRVTFNMFFRETASKGKSMTALAKLIRHAIAVEKIRLNAISVALPKDKLSPDRLADLDKRIVVGVQPMLHKMGAMTLAPSTEPDRSSGLSFHFAANAVGSLQEGPYTVFIHWTSFRNLLSIRGEEFFGGERPESDDFVR